MDDLQAILLLKHGDIRGLETLVARYQVKAMRAAYLVIHDEQLAEDMVQETFLKLFRCIHSFDDSRPFGPYLLRSVVNAALDAAQKDGKVESLGDLEAVERLLAQSISVEAQVELRESMQELQSTLEQLCPRQRATIVLRYYLQMGEKEMALTMNAAPGTIKWLLNEARTRLRKIIGPRRREQ